MVDETQVTHDPICTICNTSKSEHAERQHPFSDPKNPISPSQIFGKTRGEGVGGSGHGPAIRKPQINPAPIQVSAFPFDPVLRQALIMKGVITADDLMAAETHIRTVNNIVREVLDANVKTDGG